MTCVLVATTGEAVSSDAVFSSKKRAGEDDDAEIVDECIVVEFETVYSSSRSERYDSLAAIVLGVCSARWKGGGGCR